MTKDAKGLIERMERIVCSEYACRNHLIHDCELGQITFGDVRDLCDMARAFSAAQDGAEVELVTNADELRAELRRALAQIDSLEAECARRHAQTEAAKNDVHRLAVAICGGEDFPGLLDAQPIEALVDIVRKASQRHGETIDALLQAEAALPAAWKSGFMFGASEASKAAVDDAFSRYCEYFPRSPCARAALRAHEQGEG